ncbi:hypothetical protein FHS43_006153 [Streptosporangium becharense]|uniref:Uncharacterized protein n=1 Tax=Streptosporangium becharense TaxID=1816182 RepID=A0A7W9MHD5_9ACTN|nr:hypothetical protein [Streptosporangium becharense]MBB2914841.1 hypothetical protein [Streptosporangium becharense]MBB5820348.1 hypothetical protein [Streptosporangium becharense]
MTMLEYLTTTDAKVVDELIGTSTLENPTPMRAAKFDNKPSWDNMKKGDSTTGRAGTTGARRSSR